MKKALKKTETKTEIPVETQTCTFKLPCGMCLMSRETCQKEDVRPTKFGLFEGFAAATNTKGDESDGE